MHKDVILRTVLIKDMKLIIGLGNPGIKYKKTRHNLGFLVADFLAGNDKWKESKKANCFYLKKQINSEEVELIKPLTFMNNSGKTVNYAQKKHYINIEDIIVIHDDIDLPLGEIKIQQGRSSAGHKGVQSIINCLGTKDFIRIRLGIKPLDFDTFDTEKFVLQKFTKQEEKIIQETIKNAAAIIEQSISQRH
ncbi:MAG: aminoacyl-tRNA hydrolase [Parcubacteria group bacterium]|nr:aminoacyl-tRNA hydrolase [Parcubacteria group bacterium]